MTTVFRPADLFSSQLDEGFLEPPSATVLGGPMAVRSSIEFTSGDSRIVSGVWEAAPGLSRWEFHDRGEVIHVLEGSMTITPDGGEPSVLTAGTAAVFPLGWVGTWEVHEVIRKFFVVYKP